MSTNGPDPIDAGAVGRQCIDCGRPGWRAAGATVLCVDHWAAWTAHFAKGDQSDVEDDGWLPLLPLGRVADVPTFPTSALPDVMASFVTAAAEMTRAPVDLVAGFALGALATITAGRADASPWPGWIEPLNIWTAPIAAPGEGKSPAFSVATRPIVGIEASLRDATAREVAEAQTLRRIEETRLHDAERVASKAKADERPTLEGVARELAASLAALDEPSVPELFATDATPEAIESALAANGGRFAWLSDESGLMTMAAGRYAKDANPQNFLTAWSGAPLKTRRIGRQARVPRAVLTVSCAVQPIMLTKAARHAELVGTGFLDRFLYFVPASTVGHRPSGRTPDRSAELAQWEWLLVSTFDALGGMAGTADSPARVLSFSSEAEAAFIDWRTATEHERRPAGRLAPIVQWSTKLDGQFVRLAGLMALASDADANQVQADDAARAIVLTDYFVDHAAAALALAGADGPMADARAVAGWIAARRERVVSRRDVHRAFEHRFATLDDLRPVLNLLIEYGYVREVELAAGPKGGRPSLAYEVNPALHVPTT